MKIAGFEHLFYPRLQVGNIYILLKFMLAIQKITYDDVRKKIK